MKDTELTNELTVRLNWSKQDVESMLDTLGHVIGERLAGNDTLYLQGLGQFEPKKKAERMTVNPTNGKRYLIPPKLIVGFKPVITLKTYLKSLDSHE
jgi:DNA-binding protein HU-beta